MIEQSKGILVDSELGKQHVIESYNASADEIFVLPYIPPKYIYDNKNIISENINRDLPDKYIFYPAQFWEHKNHTMLIEAMKLLKGQGINVNIVFVGTNQGEHRTKVYQNLLDLIKKYALEQQVSFLGYMNDEYMSILYKRARGLVMPTFFGPTNIPPLEAFVMGCPVAVSNVYAMPSQLKDAALYFDPTSVEEIAKCIKILWEDDEVCKELIIKGLKLSKEWGPNQFSERLIDIVNRLT